MVLKKLKINNLFCQNPEKNQNKIATKLIILLFVFLVTKSFLNKSPAMEQTQNILPKILF